MQLVKSKRGCELGKVESKPVKYKKLIYFIHYANLNFLFSMDRFEHNFLSWSKEEQFKKGYAKNVPKGELCSSTSNVRNAKQSCL